MSHNLTELKETGLTIFQDQFSLSDLTTVNNIASEIQPHVGLTAGGDWYNGWRMHEESETKDMLNDVNWAYHWCLTPEENPFIKDKLLPTLASVCDQAFEGRKWDWQKTNCYIMTNNRHDFGASPHFDAPYLWPQKPHIQMAKYLDEGPLSITFMVPLIDFTVENGATGYVTNTHKHIWDTEDWTETKQYMRKFFNDNYIQPEVPLGDFACFYGNVLHAIMRNNTDIPRRGIIYRAIRQDALDEMAKHELG